MKVEYDGLADSMSATTTQVGVPGRLRVQDIDQDGYPDFAVTMNFIDSSNQS